MLVLLWGKKHASTVTESKFSLTFLFVLCFHFEKLIFAVYPTLCHGGSLLFLFDSSVFAKRYVIY